MQIARNGHQVALWGHDPIHVAELVADSENRRFLPGFPFPETIRPMDCLDDTLAECDACMIVVPSHAFADVVAKLSDRLPPRTGLAWATKGLDPTQGQLLHVTARAVFPDANLAVISGPSFAREVAQGLPTAVSVASNDLRFATKIAGLLHGGRFRAYTSADMVGVEISGAAKNVLAIATGIADGLGFGANARAALITRGLTELIRLGTSLGGRPETFMGLAGVGDLVLTCTDDQSRNRRMGLALARGQNLEDAKADIGQEVEGVVTAHSIHILAKQLGIEMPISEQVYRVLYEGISPLQATATLLEREPKAEFG